MSTTKSIDPKNIKQSIENYYSKRINYKYLSNDCISIALPIYFSSKDISLYLFIRETENEYILTTNLVNILEMECRNVLPENVYHDLNVFDFIKQNCTLHKKVTEILTKDNLQLTDNFEKEIRKDKVKNIGMEVVLYAEAFRKFFDLVYNFALAENIAVTNTQDKNSISDNNNSIIEFLTSKFKNNSPSDDTGYDIYSNNDSYFVAYMPSSLEDSVLAQRRIAKKSKQNHVHSNNLVVNNKSILSSNNLNFRNIAGHSGFKWKGTSDQDE